MANPAYPPGAFVKPSVGDRLRARQKDADTESRTLSALYRYVYKRDQYKCVACRRPVVVGAIEELKRAHPHHIQPRSLADKAVKHTKENVCCVCPFCHADIGDKKLFISGNAETHLTIRRVR